MYAIEFETKLRGNLISIPEKYKDFVSKHVKVIVMMDKNKENVEKKRVAGSAKGKIKISEDFEKPLDEETISEFEWEKEIENRIHAVDNGTAIGVDYKTVKHHQEIRGVLYNIVFG